MSCVDANQLKHKLRLTDRQGNVCICVIRNGAARENWTPHKSQEHQLL